LSAPRIPRRVFLARALGIAGAAFLAPSCAATQRARFSADPFSLGVASGSPLPDGVVLWTRLAPKPLEGGGMDPVDLEVRWEVAHDEAFARIAAKGTALARADRAHAVHVECSGLDPARGYFYRFIAGDATSPVARTRTAPARGQAGRLRIALASCQRWDQGFYAAHEHIARDDVDLVVFVGDYIYESDGGGVRVRAHASSEPRTLQEYRDRYAQYKTDPALQKSHAAAPWIVTWDDHEVANDYANDRSQELDGAFLARRAAAYRAYLEAMPIRPGVLRPDGEMRIYDRFEWGSLATFHVLDDRQYRSHQACPRAGRGGSNVVGASCTERLDPARTLLGSAQERWLDEGLGASKARWNLLAQQTLLAVNGQGGPDNTQHWTDGWDGYPAARARLLRSIAERRPANPVILGGDVHAAFVADVHADLGRRESPVIAGEVCATSVSSRGMGDATLKSIVQSNPHLRYAENKMRGYSLLELTADKLEVRMRAVASHADAQAGVSTAATFTAEAGRPGFVR
jgi:alkaline phosphatase D